MALVGETLSSGANPTCEDCGKTPRLQVCHSAAGYYVGTYCDCGPYSRESGYYASREKAQRALDTGAFGRPTGSDAPLREMLSLMDDPCPSCGGIHVSIEGLDAVGISELEAQRCNGSLAVSRGDIIRQIGE